MCIKHKPGCTCCYEARVSEHGMGGALYTEKNASGPYPVFTLPSQRPDNFHPSNKNYSDFLGVDWHDHCWLVSNELDRKIYRYSYGGSYEGPAFSPTSDLINLNLTPQNGWEGVDNPQFDSGNRLESLYFNSRWGFGYASWAPDSYVVNSTPTVKRYASFDSEGNWVNGPFENSSPRHYIFTKVAVDAKGTCYAFHENYEGTSGLYENGKKISLLPSYIVNDLFHDGEKLYSFGRSPTRNAYGLLHFENATPTTRPELLVDVRDWFVDNDEKDFNAIKFSGFCFWSTAYKRAYVWAILSGANVEISYREPAIYELGYAGLNYTARRLVARLDHRKPFPISPGTPGHHPAGATLLRKPPSNNTR